MTAPVAASSSLQRIGLGDFDAEMASTRRILERVPDEHWDWKPHPKSGTLGQVASHVATVIGLQNAVVRFDDFDILSRGGARPEPSKSRAELLETFDRTVASVRESIAALGDDAAWSKSWTFRRGDHVIFVMPKAAAFRTMGINHLVHHRGQLSVYLRLLDVPVPGMYGPSADER
jgi:uncharacterized damage-inducible protein DinB